MNEDLKPSKGVLIEGTIIEDFWAGQIIVFNDTNNDIYPLMQDDIDYLTMRNYKPNGNLIEAYLTECTTGGKTTLKAKLKSVNI